MTPPKPGRIDATTFYGRPPPPTPPRGVFLRRVAQSPYQLAGILFALGFWAVFVNQANLLHQIVLGAPIFEEFVKVGLGLLLVTALRIRWGFLRVAAGALPGLGFGVLEHSLVYSSEPALQYALRVLFHAGASGLGLATYHVLEVLGDVRVRWGLTLPGTVIHYANNVLAVVLGVTGLFGPETEPVAMGVSTVLAASTWALSFFFLTAAAPLRGLVRRRFPDPRPAGPVAAAAMAEDGQERRAEAGAPALERGPVGAGRQLPRSPQRRPKGPVAPSGRRRRTTRR